ncbi:uncharacterized protein LOC132204403 [Neocloeon triangulifer]|uniref:uncharacterized protein LOC132204403 n=1 Tax=Neocloeon triangulifer TaxID=2078957 RepID=UPI00286F7E56|nr:uncharacterized protein LOC132204403 [Neocloeon triangulifer]
MSVKKKMVRILMLLFFILATVLADGDPHQNSKQSTKVQHSDQGLMENINQKLDSLTKLVVEHISETKRQVEVQNEELKKLTSGTNRRLDQLAALVDQHHNQLLNFDFAGKCLVSRSTQLTTLSRKTYFFDGKTRGNWSLANETCRQHGLHLATIGSVQELRMVWNEARSIDDSKDWWVSAKKEDTDYHWLDGSKLPEDSSLWWRYRTNDTDDCVSIAWLGEGTLLTESCNKTLNFVCQLPDNCYN